MTNIKNRTIFEGDNLNILRGINSESIDLLYLDPMFIPIEIMQRSYAVFRHYPT